MGGKPVTRAPEVPESLEDHIDGALEAAVDDEVLFHLRHAKQLLVVQRAVATADGDLTDTRADEHV